MQRLFTTARLPYLSIILNGVSCYLGLTVNCTERSFSSVDKLLCQTSLADSKQVTRTYSSLPSPQRNHLDTSSSFESQGIIILLTHSSLVASRTRHSEPSAHNTFFCFFDLEKRERKFSEPHIRYPKPSIPRTRILSHCQLSKIPSCTAPFWSSTLLEPSKTGPGDFISHSRQAAERIGEDWSVQSTWVHPRHTRYSRHHDTTTLRTRYLQRHYNKAKL